MPGQQQPPTATIYFDRLTGGMMPYVDPLVAGPQTYPHIWKDLKNLIPWRGRLQRREGADAPLGTSLSPPEGPTDDYPILIVGFQFGEHSERYLVVTTQEMWISSGDDDDWFLITPQYPAVALGLTVSVVNGSPNVTGSAGSDWLARRIGPGQKIYIDGDWYEIASVGPLETNLVLTTNFTGLTGSYSYSIRRTFYATDGQQQYAAAVALNGDIYVTIHGGGVTLSGSATIGGNTGVVLKITRGVDNLKTSFDWTDVSIVMSTAAMDTDTYALGQLFHPKGLEVLEDGRLVLAAHVWQYAGTQYQASNRVLFSSHLDVFDWGINGGGFVDLIGARGGITAMKRFGGALAVHFQDQIQLGQITGSDFDPLAWRPTRATCGAGAPRLIMSVPATANLPGGQVFLANTGELHIFDGDNSPRIPSAWADIIRDRALEDLADSGSFDFYADLILKGHFGYDEYRRSVSLFYPHALVGGMTAELRFDLDTGVNTRHVYHALITATNQPRIMPFTSQLTSGDFYYAARIIGVRGTDFEDNATAYLYSMHLDALEDTLPQTDALATSDGILAETHDLMLGAPDRESRVLRVIVWYNGRTSTSETLCCDLSVDSGVNWEAGVGETTVALEDSFNERRMTFYFSTSPPADRARIRIREDAGTGFDAYFPFALTRTLIEYATVADVRAVP